MLTTLTTPRRIDYSHYSDALQALKNVFTRVEGVQLRAAWDIGKIIDRHILANRKRGEYSKKVLKKFASDLDKNSTELYYSLQFTRAYPIFPSMGKLGLTHVRQLLTVQDSRKRQHLTNQASRESWSVAKLTRHIQTHQLSRATQKPIPQKRRKVKIIPSRGVVGLAQVIERNILGKPALLLDLGAKCRKELAGFTLEVFAPGTILQILKSDKFKMREDVTEKDLYTYEASLERVVDGDTLLVHLNLGLGVWQEERVRLRGIDAPELKTPEGEHAKTFVEKQFKNVKRFVVKTSRHEGKWGRYIVDVFLGDIFLNQLLVDSGHAEI